MKHLKRFGTGLLIFAIVVGFVIVIILPNKYGQIPGFIIVGIAGAYFLGYFIEIVED